MRPAKCPECGEVFGTVAGVLSHDGAAHDGDLTAGDVPRLDLGERSTTGGRENAPSRESELTAQ